LVVGIAGGTRPEQQQYGDILVSESILYYEPQKLRPRGAEFRTQSLLPDPLLYDRALNFRNGWVQKIPTELLAHSALDRAPKVFFGPIASGEKVVADESFVSKLRNLQPKAVGIEMESAGVASAALASIFGTGFLAIRSISDFADHRKGDDWQELAAHSAAAWAVSFIKSSPIPDEPLEDIPSFRQLGVSRSIPDRLAIFEEIQARIDMEGFRVLCFLLNVDIDELGGEKKSTRVAELIKLFERRGELQRLKEMWAEFKEKRYF
jgi:nucleoside phosphorylase